MLSLNQNLPFPRGCVNILLPRPGMTTASDKSQPTQPNLPSRGPSRSLGGLVACGLNKMWVWPGVERTDSQQKAACDV